LGAGLLIALSSVALLAVRLAADEAPAKQAAQTASKATDSVDFNADIKPLLAKRCYECHGGTAAEGNLRLDDRAAAFKGGDGGAAIVAGDLAKSAIIERIESTDDELRMPHGKPALPAEEIALLKRWIAGGAKWPAEAVVEANADHWSLRPLVRPALPAPSSTASAARCRNPIDWFIAAKLEQQSLTPAPEADRQTLIRRLAFNLAGLPPTPEEVEAFEADASPDAYERLVDRMLASPALGERWARHWMDVVHFAETHGNDQDRPRPNAWPYRDYLIAAFNTDKPYRRFIREQVAGDVLFPGDPQALVATGMLAAGPWDESSQRDIVDDTTDKKVAQLLDRDDMLSTVISTVSSTTVHCARCHAHKFDPIPQADYYALSAVFAGVDRAERTYDRDPATFAKRQSLLAEKKRLDAGLSDAELASAEVASRVAKWESSYVKRAGDWTVLQPAVAKSQNGATSNVLPDGSILFSGKRPERDTYVISAASPLRKVTAVRLEVLADDSLPHHGPGRQDNGNLHLTEFKMSVGSPAQSGSAPAVPMAKATADFDQQGWEIGKALDGVLASAWGIFPSIGQSHVAVFQLRKPLEFDAATDLTFTLDQLHGGGHLIGRPRISVTDAEGSLSATPVPAEIAPILSTPAAQRTDAQRRTLALHVLRLEVNDAIAALPAPSRVYVATSDFTPENNFKPAAKPREVMLLRRGDINQPAGAVEPGALSCVKGLPSRFQLPAGAGEGARRAALANWLTHDDNVLTWRSIVNRVWHYHFGRGIVDSPNDLGRMGSPPTHPELLDWLAVEFRGDKSASTAEGDAAAHADRFKRLHRLLLASATYRQSSRHNDECAKLDSGNRFLWRMNRARLDAEAVRDAVLAVSGKLDRTMGGPSVKQFVESPGVHVTPIVDYNKFDVDSPGNYRRSVYRFVFRTLPDPFMESMDCPDPSQLAPTRNTSVTPLQALAMLNDRLIVRQSEHFATRLQTSSGNLHEQLAWAIQLAFGRPANDHEVAALAEYAAKYGLANACRVLLNSNEFMFVN
jgi:hypothetical protein